MSAASSSAAAGPSSTAAGGAPANSYECEICLEDPTEPVVTFCGHLYCWPCLYRWLRSGHSVCPVCKSGVTEQSVIPLYGRGRERVDPRTKRAAAPAGGGDGAGAAGAAAGGGGDGAGSSGGAGEGAGAQASAGPDADVPSRPPGQRSEPPPNAAEAWPGGMGGMGGPQLQFAAGFGFFPSLFGLQFQAVHTGGGGGRAVGPADPHQTFLDRAMLALAAVVLFFMLFL